MALYWVGSRESDAPEDIPFAGKIVIYGNPGNQYGLNNRRNIRINNNTVSITLEDFLVECFTEITSNDTAAKFYFYDPSWIYKMCGLSAFSSHFICVNEEAHYTLLNNKLKFREFVREAVPVLPTKTIEGRDCTYHNLCTVFNKSSGRFIIQVQESSGGEGTFCINGRNAARVIAQLDSNTAYIVSEYISDNIPVNIHVIISNDTVRFYPGSVQLVRFDNDRLLYRGADFQTYRTIPRKVLSEFESNCAAVAELLQKNGYLGICGIDGLICGDRVFITEVNPRFQASTAVLNIALIEAGFPSIQLCNLGAFQNEFAQVPKGARDLAVNYSSYSYHNYFAQTEGNYILENAKSEPYVKRIDLDGYSPNDNLDNGIYMFRLIFSRNISGVNPAGGINLHELVCEPDQHIYKKICKLDLLAVKIALLSFGVKIDEPAKQWLVANGGIRPGNNNAVDLDVMGIIINSPLDIDFITFTPFRIILLNQKLVLCYYSLKLCEVHVYPLDPLASKRTSRGVPYTTVAYLSTDRLRIHMTNECVYKATGKSCQFCNITPCEDPILIEDIREVVRDYIYHSPGATHFLVGGQSMGQAAGKRRIIEMVQAIRDYEKAKHIYVMALPYDKPTIKSLVDAGINELSCNIEIFDDALARKYMPGKGEITRKKYYDVLSYARTLLPQKGSVRSMLILGLEPDKSFITGVEKLFSLGIQPIISLFRPLPNTPLERYIAPSLKYIYDMYIKLERIGKKYGMHLGPACVHCQNNTLSMPYDNQ